MAIGVYPDSGFNTAVSFSLATTADSIVYPVSGTDWASVKVIFAAQGSSPQITLAYSIDGGANFLTSGAGAPYAKDIGTVSANPTVKAFSSIQTTTAQTWEFPLAANVTHVKASVAVNGTAQAVTVSGAQRYVPGMEVKAQLYDVTEGSTGAGVAAVVHDLSGWQAATINFTVPTTQVWTARFLDSAGASVVPGITTTAAGSSVLTLSKGGPSLSTLTLASNSINSIGMVWPRISTTLPAGGTVSTGRAVVMVSR